MAKNKYDIFVIVGGSLICSFCGYNDDADNVLEKAAALDYSKFPGTFGHEDQEESDND